MAKALDLGCTARGLEFWVWAFGSEVRSSGLMVGCRACRV